MAVERELALGHQARRGCLGDARGGLYNMHLEGSGWVALTSDGPPVLLDLDGRETYADPQAAITWSSGVSTSVNTDASAPGHYDAQCAS
jgi:uncharacterized protein (AIM24 family)